MMTRGSNSNITPGGKQSTRRQTATGISDSGDPGLTRFQRKSEFSGKLPPKVPTYIGTFNINTLIQPGKLQNLTSELERQRILILALQETRIADEETIDYGSYRMFKSKTEKRVARGAPLLGMAFMVHKNIINSIKEVTPINNRLMTMRVQCANKRYTMINVHAPTNQDNKKEPEKTEEFWAKLEDVMSKIPKDDVKILLGDFNAQIGKEKIYRKTVGDFPAHKFTNKNGIRLIELCKQNNLKLMSTSLRKSPRKQKTWRSPIQQMGEFQIDHVAISYPVQKEIHNIQVRRGANIDSDHYMVRVKVKFTPRRIHPKKACIQKFDTRKIKESNIKEQWEKERTDTWEGFRSKITQRAQELIPLKKNTKHPWWDSVCENALEERKRAYLKYNSNKTPENQQAFNETRRAVAKTIRQIKRKHMKEQLESIEENFRNYNTRDFYKTFAGKIRGYTPQNLCFRKQNGKLALTNQENTQVLAQYFSDLLNCPEPSTRFPKGNCVDAHPESQPPTQEEIRKHIFKLKNNKTSGEDGIIAELLKNLGPNSLQDLSQIITNIWRTEKLPDEWKCALIHPLHKKGDKTDVNNYRGISLLQVTYKILSACLLQRTQAQLEHKIGEYQAGFRPGRSCAEQIFNLKTILKHKAVRNAPIICTFVDFKKAYDSIDRLSLFNILEEYGLDLKTLRLIKQTLTGTTSKVKFMGEISEPFLIKTGVRQGDGLSPLLFNLALDKVIKEWEKELKIQGHWKPIRLGRPKDNIEVSCLAFADDLAILSDNEETAGRQIEILKESAEKVGLQISFEKTEFFCSKLQIQKLSTRYGEINRVAHFKYLGEIIEPTGGEKIAQKTRLQKMKRAYGMTHDVYNKKCISKHCKIRHYNTVVKPAALYASETLTLHAKTDMESLLKEERKIMRKILGPKLTDEGYRLHSRKTTESMSNLAEDIRKRRLKFYGHISRLPPTRLTNRILTYIKGVKSTTPWITHVRTDLERAQIDSEEINNRITFGNKIYKWKVMSENEVPKRPGTKWTEERKRIHGQRMREVWMLRRKNQK